MSLPILRVFDFDQTLTKQHTFGLTHFFTPATNSKIGLEKLILHDDQHITAIATYHNDVDYILSYLLPLLKLTKAELIKTVICPHEKHKMTSFYFKDKKFPLVISSVDTIQHRQGGKNTALEAIARVFPFCETFHFYDDDVNNINEALKLGFFNCHWVKNSVPHFDLWETKLASKPNATNPLDQVKPFVVDCPELPFNQPPIVKPKTIDDLINLLSAYKMIRENNQHLYSGWGSFFSFNFFGYSKKEKLDSVNALIDCLKTGEPFNASLFEGPLSEGKLGDILRHWQFNTGLNWLDQVDFIQERSLTS